MTVGGDVRDIVTTNPLTGTHTWYPMAGEAGTMSLGGNIVQSETNGVAGGGAEMVYSRKGERAFFEVPCACDTAVREDNVVWKGLQESTAETTATITLNNGTIYKFKGMCVGAMELDTSASTFTWRIEGVGEKIG